MGTINPYHTAWLVVPRIECINELKGNDWYVEVGVDGVGEMREGGAHVPVQSTPYRTP